MSVLCILYINLLKLFIKLVMFLFKFTFIIKYKIHSCYYILQLINFKLNKLHVNKDLITLYLLVNY